MNVYECTIILNPEMPDSEAEAYVNKVRDMIVAGGGEVLKTDVWGRRRMAFEIAKKTKGLYVLLTFRSPSPVIRKIEDFFKVSDQVIKFMVIRLEKKQREAVLKALTAAAEAAPAAAPSAEAAGAPAAAAPAAEGA